ncbi:MAG: hypothetical protein M3Z24_13590 [Chloroflexota bacterium]|nr:hypothetical protein [Chloroflexota bacterium]
MGRDKVRRSDNDDWRDEQLSDDEEYYQPRPQPRHTRPVQPGQPPRPTRTGQPRPVTQQRSSRQQPRPQPQRRQRSFLSGLLIGCASVIILLVLAAGVIVFLTFHNATSGPLGGINSISTGTQYTQKNEQPVALTTISRLQVHNTIGNVTIMVDSSVPQPTVSTLKKVQATSQDAANSEFKNITVQVQPNGTDSATLAVNATISNDTSIIGSHPNSVDITIKLPASVNNSSGTPLLLNANASIGNITSVGNVLIDGLNGVFDIKDDLGNVTVQNATLMDGSCLETGQGKVTFTGMFDTSKLTHLQLCSSNAASTDSSTQPSYKLHSEVGDVDITLPANTPVNVKATINVGTINSDFSINPAKNTDGTVSYDGPFNPNGAQPTATVIVDVSTGDIHLHS